MPRSPAERLAAHGVSLLYAAGSSGFAILIGVSSAWLVARTNAYFRQLVVIAAYLSLAAPVIIKGIGWILLLGPNKGLINEWLRMLLGSSGVPIELFTLGGMILLEAILWSPVVFLLMLPALSAMDASLEEAAAMSGASRWQTFHRVTLRLAFPGILQSCCWPIRSPDLRDPLISRPATPDLHHRDLPNVPGFLPRTARRAPMRCCWCWRWRCPLAGYCQVTRQAEIRYHLRPAYRRPARSRRAARPAASIFADTARALGAAVDPVLGLCCRSTRRRRGGFRQALAANYCRVLASGDALRLWNGAVVRR